MRFVDNARCFHPSHSLVRHPYINRAHDARVIHPKKPQAGQYSKRTKHSGDTREENKDPIFSAVSTRKAIPASISEQTLADWAAHYGPQTPPRSHHPHDDTGFCLDGITLYLRQATRPDGSVSTCKDSIEERKYVDDRLRERKPPDHKDRDR